MAFSSERSIDVFLSKKLTLLPICSALTEYSPSHLVNPSIDYLSFCLICPKFDYVPHCNKVDQKALRAPQTFLNSKVLEKIEEIRPRLQANPSSSSRSVPSLSVYDEAYQSPKNDPSQKSVLVLYIQLEDLVSSELSQDDVMLKSNWSDSIRESIFTLRKYYNSNDCRIISLMGAGVRQTLFQYNKNRFVDDFIAELQFQHNVDVQWTTINDKDGGEWIKRTIRAIEECKLKSIPSAFKAKGKSSTHKSTPKTADTWWLEQLVQIPGIQRESARAIMKEFKTPHALIEHFSTSIIDHQSSIDKIASIEVTSLAKERKLGRALALRLFRLYNPKANPMGWVLRD